MPRLTDSYATSILKLTGGLGGTLGAPHRAPPASFGAVGHDLATSRRGRGRGTRLTTRSGSCRRVAQRDQTGDVCRASPAQDVRRPSDHSQQRTRGPAAVISDRDRGRGVASFSNMAATAPLTISHE